MKVEKIFSGNNLEEVAKEFSEIIARNHLEHLEFWKSTVKGKELNTWRKRIKAEPRLVRKNSHKKILEIMQKVKENEKFYKQKWLLFTDENQIVITKDSGFYEDLLPDQDITYSVHVNRKYIIDKKNLCIFQIK